MKRNLFFIITAVALLALVTLACSLVSGTPDKAPDSPAEAEQVIEGTVPEDQIAEEPPEEAQPATDIELGDEYRSEAGGYAFLPVPGYRVEEFFGMTAMTAPDADEELGPLFMFIGGTNEVEMDQEQLVDDFEAELDEGTTITEQRDVTVGGVPGTLVEVEGEEEGTPVRGRVVIVSVTPTQQFSLFAVAPAARWGEIGSYFDAVLASVNFFEPVEEDIFDLPEETEEVEETAQTEVIRQWAVSAFASSEWDTSDYTAMQATGAPDTLVDECTDAPTAWAAYGSDTVEWIELTYATPVVPTEINIHQNHSPDQVAKVEVIDQSYAYHVVYEGTPVDRWEECPYTLSIPVAFDQPVVGVKITLDQTVIGIPWNEIDAVELVGMGDASAVTDTGGTTDTSGGVFTGSLGPGEFSFMITNQVDAPTLVEGSTLQYQSTTEEYVIGLVSPDERHTLTLFLPFELSDGLLTLVAYDSASPTKGPSTAIYVGFKLYVATEGFIDFVDTAGGKITGTFYFSAVNKDDASDTIIVTGEFSQLPLE